MNLNPCTPPLDQSPPDSDDRMGRMYALLHRAGEHMGIWFGRCADGAAAEAGRVGPKWVNLPHWKFDGIGGFCELLRERDITDEIFRTTSHRAPPFVARLKVMRRRFYDRHHAPKELVILGNPEWLMRPEQNQSENSVGWKVLSREATLALVAKANAHGVSANSLLLWSLDRAARQLWMDPRATATRWGIPVNLRGAVRKSRNSANHSAMCDIVLPAKCSIENIHECIRAELLRGSPWARWDIIQLSKWFPRRKREAAVQKMASSPPIYTGIFSNLGRWGETLNSQNSRENEAAWLFAPPTARTSPVVSGAITWGGRLGLTLLAHPSMGVTDSQVQQWIETWVALTTSSGRAL